METNVSNQTAFDFINEIKSLYEGLMNCETNKIKFNNSFKLMPEISYNRTGIQFNHDIMDEKLNCPIVQFKLMVYVNKLTHLIEVHYHDTVHYDCYAKWIRKSVDSCDGITVNSEEVFNMIMMLDTFINMKDTFSIDKFYYNFAFKDIN